MNLSFRDQRIRGFLLALFIYLCRRDIGRSRV